jgi:hypothetical protein
MIFISCARRLFREMSRGSKWLMRVRQDLQDLQDFISMKINPANLVNPVYSSPATRRTLDIFAARPLRCAVPQACCE